MIPSRRPAWLLVPAVVLLGASAATSCLGGPALPTPAPPTGAVVEIKGFQFPADMAIKKGQAIAFRNLDPAVHNVAPAPGSTFEKSADIKTGETQAVTFKEPGTYEVRCDYHSSMKGTVTVE